MPPWVMMRRGRRWTSHKVKSTLPKPSLPYWPHRGRQGKTFSQELFFVQLCTDTVVIWQWGRVFLACLLVWRLDSAHQGSWSRANKSNSVVERNIINLGTLKQPFCSASIKLYFAIFSLFYALQINSYLLSRTTRIIGQFPDTDTKRWCYPKQKLSFGHSGHLRPATQ